MSITFLHTKIFKNSNTGWDAFSLSIKKINGDHKSDDHFFFDSDIIPIALLSYYDELIDRKYIYNDQLDDFPEFSYLNDLLDIVAEYLFKDERNQRFYYPFDFLDNEFDLDVRKISLFIKAKTEIKNCSLNYVDENRPYHLHYINQLFQVQKPARNRFFYKKKRITRVEFESYLEYNDSGVAYVEIYKIALSFKILKDRHNNELLACCFCKHNKVILAINISK